MAYTKTVWQDRQVQYPMTFTQSTAANGGTTLTPNEGTVTQAGTAFTAATMNNIENGVANVDSRMTTTEGNVSTLQNQMSTANTNISNLQGSSVNKSGDTMTGTLTVPTLAATNVTEGGTALSTKYQPKYSTGTSAPSTVPSSVGLLYIDTASKKAYVSTATTAASDWEQIDQVDWTNILNKPTTVGTFGITDVYTKTQSDAQYNPKYLTGTATPSTIPSQVGMLFIDTTNKKAYVSTGTSASTDWEQIDQVDWSNILNKPTTVAGFGITDTYTKTQSDAQYNPKYMSGTSAPASVPTSIGVIYIDTTNKNVYISTGTGASTDWDLVDNVQWANVLSKPTTLAGFAISDAYTKTQTDAQYHPKFTSGTAAPAVAPTAVGLLYIDTTNKKAYISTGTTAQSDWEQIDQVDWSNILNKPTTVAGFGITDTYTKTQSDTNYYTKAQTDAQYNPKFLTGTAAPTTTPTSVGVWFIDTTNKHAYVSTGTASSSDWEMLDQITWSNVLSKPTTLAGYAISDVYDKTTSDGRFAPISGSANYENKGVAYDKATSDGKYVKNTGDTINGNLNVSTFGFTGGGSVKFDAYGNVTAVGTTSSTWNVTDSASNSAFNVKMDGSKRVATANNVLDDGSGGATVAGVFKAPSVRNSASDLGTHYDAGEMGWYDWNQSRHALRYVRSTNTVSTDGSINATGGITNGADYFQIVCYPGKGATNLIAKLWYDGTAGNLNFYNQLNGTIGLYAKAFTTSSNRELKTNIVKDEENALEKVKATTVYNYQFKQDLEDWGEDADGNLVLLGQKDPSTVPVQTGIIVDEAPKDIIGENGESINLYAMTTLLWKAVQELSAKNDSLEQRILALEGK